MKIYSKSLLGGIFNILVIWFTFVLRNGIFVIIELTTFDAISILQRILKCLKDMCFSWGQVGGTKRHTAINSICLIQGFFLYSRTKNTRLSGKYWSLAARRGKKKALVAIGHRMLTIIYYMLLRQEPYHELPVN